MLDLEVGNALLQCADKLRQLLAELPPQASLGLHLAVRELAVTIYLNDQQGSHYRFIYRLEPGEADDYMRQELAEAWDLAMRKLRIGPHSEQPPSPCPGS